MAVEIVLCEGCQPCHEFSPHWFFFFLELVNIRIKLYSKQPTSSIYNVNVVRGFGSL